jgi:diguanylate cyclase (GGDEF)-like protein
VIRDAADVLRGVLRDADLAARIGGDEFVAMLPGLAREAGDALMLRLAAAVRAHERADRSYRLSVSADLTFVEWYGEASLEGMLAEADAKMYARKRARAGSSQPAVRAPCEDRGTRGQGLTQRCSVVAVEGASSPRHVRC